MGHTPEIFAIYLPQFHRTPYNDKWWGDGYTEWTACKQARPMFHGHYQPREPKDDNYYDLSDLNSIRWQVKTANKYGIDGFAIYHYYSLEKRLLEKPLVLLRENEDLEIKYYLYWANHDWRRNWFGYDQELLWSQKYGTEKDWKRHYQYCKHFFDDRRYVKIDNKPVFVIFNDWHFSRIDEYINLWNDLAHQDGFDGIYFVKTAGPRSNSKLGKFNSVFERQPFFAMARGEKALHRIKRIVLSRVYIFCNSHNLFHHVEWTESYERICRRISQMQPSAGSDTILGAFPDWDNTPRKYYGGSYFVGTDPEIFEECLYNQIQKAKQYDCKQIIINAWNEWAEGSYLEPDKKYEYRYLDAIKNAKARANEKG